MGINLAILLLQNARRTRRYSSRNRLRTHTMTTSTNSPVVKSSSEEEERVRIAEAMDVQSQFFIKKRGLYYRPNAKGYTSCPNCAWLVSEEVANRHAYPHDEPVTKHPAPLPDYHHDANAALSICEWMRGRKWRVAIETTNTGWDCTFIQDPIVMRGEQADTLPAAICSAFLAYLDGREG